MIDWNCPSCRGPLVPGSDAWTCGACRESYRALRGIPDLRTRDDVYLDNAADREFALRLLDDFDRLDFRGLLERYYELEPTEPRLRRRQIHHILTAPGRVGAWLDALGDRPSGPLLDLGCGSGSFLATVGGRVPEVVGVDVALRWLVVARKRLDEDGLGDVPLVCACAEDLPIAEASVGGIVAGDVIEHVADQAATLAECHRVLASGGRLFLAAPNRYSLAREPHVQVWGVGFLPRRLMAAYVRTVAGVDFRAIRTLGAGEWERLLRSSPFGTGRLTVPPLPRDDLAAFGPGKRTAARAYNAFVATEPGRRIGQWFGPLFHVVCEKPGVEAPRPTTRATRRGSRPKGATA